MSRRKPATSDSLDLLLDTICNTFGGVLFIAMLVIILLNMSGHKAASVPATEEAKKQLEDSQAQLAISQAELERLRRAANEQARIASQLADPAVKAVLDDMHKSQSSVTAAAAKNAANLQTAAEKQKEINKIADEMAKLEEALKLAREQLAQIESRLKQERDLRTRTVNLPKQKESAKNQIAFLLQGGKLYAYLRLGSSGVPEPDTRDTRTVTVGSTIYLEPIPGGGVDLKPPADIAAVAAQKFKGWDPSQHFIAVIVWPDSFEQFPAVRQALVERGFEYQLQPMPDGTRAQISENISKTVQ